MILPREFYRQPVQAVAHDILGKRLVRQFNGKKVAGIIIEAEAYDGEQDQACHARSGKTKRNEMMYGRAGHAYVYFTYGMHWMFNCVSGEDGYPAAVLIRAIYPDEGLDIIQSNRKGVIQTHWCNGPAKLTKALAITNEFNGLDLCDPKGSLFIENGIEVPTESIRSTPRIGIQNTPEPWLGKPWRFVVEIPPDNAGAF